MSTQQQNADQPQDERADIEPEDLIDHSEGPDPASIHYSTAPRSLHTETFGLLPLTSNAYVGGGPGTGGTIACQTFAEAAAGDGWDVQVIAAKDEWRKCQGVRGVSIVEARGDRGYLESVRITEAILTVQPGTLTHPRMLVIDPATPLLNAPAGDWTEHLLSLMQDLHTAVVLRDHGGTEPLRVGMAIPLSATRIWMGRPQQARPRELEGVLGVTGAWRACDLEQTFARRGYGITHLTGFMLSAGRLSPVAIRRPAR